MSNRLNNETSPYLLLHKDNPVEWYPWGKEALAAAEAQNKPILLSVGYTACHWCHVMNHESFADSETAALMNEEFVNVKVDREERPDIDQIYQAAANAMGVQGGWPLTMFLTPKGIPIWASTYSPKEERLGMAPFKKVLEHVSRIYRDRGPELIANGEKLVAQLNQVFNRDTKGRIDPAILDSAAIRIGQRYDIFFGGTVGAPKFPNVTLLDVLWRAFLRTGTTQFLQIVSTTLDHMLLGGLYDHIGGGFARYCVDERWGVPHFEKMLYDNAMILELMTSVWQFNRNSLCRDRIAETVGFLLRDMTVADAFASSIDADSEGEEGKYYIWSETEIESALAGTYVQRFKDAYNVTREGNFEGKNILLRGGSKAPYPQSEADEALFKKQRELLLQVRSQRVPPIRDDKILADWNGLVIAALANAGAVFQIPEWTAAAARAFDFIVRNLSEGDRLFHSWHGGKHSREVFADDYANMIAAALRLFELSGERRYLEHACTWTKTLNAHFWDAAQGGYFLTSDEADALILRTRTLFDQPLPSANGTMLAQLVRLYLTTQDSQYAQRVDQLYNALAGEASRAYMSAGSFFAGLETALAAQQIVIVGPSDNPKTHELVATVLGRSLPNRLLMVVPPERSLPEGHPAFGKTMQNGLPAAYLCQRGTCAAPITNPVALSQALQLPLRVPAGQQIQ